MSQCLDPVTDLSGTCAVIDTTIAFGQGCCDKICYNLYIYAACSSQAQVFLQVLNAAAVIFQCLVNDIFIIQTAVPTADLTADTWVNLTNTCTSNSFSVRAVIDWNDTATETGYRNFTTDWCFTDASACQVIHCESADQVPCDLISLSGSGYSDLDGIYNLLGQSDWAFSKPKYEKYNSTANTYSHIEADLGNWLVKDNSGTTVLKLPTLDTNIGASITDNDNWNDEIASTASSATWECV